VFITFLFSDDPEGQYPHVMRLFTDSLSYHEDDFDFWFIGNASPPGSLPSKVRYLHISWDNLIDRLQLVLRMGCDAVYALRSSHIYYKVCDWKPLIGSLFASELSEYKYWGVLDNDMILGESMHRDIVSNLDDEVEIYFMVKMHKLPVP